MRLLLEKNKRVFHQCLSEKSLGRNHDLSVAEYKVAKETEHLEQLQEQVHDADIELLASQIAYKELERRQTKELNEKTDAIVKKNEAMEQEYTDKKEYYSKGTIQWEIKAHNRTGTVEQMDANVEAMARDLQEILRLSSEQNRLWEVYEGR